MNRWQGGTAGQSIEFESHAPFRVEQVRTIKICECCGKNFFRSELSMAQECDACTQALAKAQAERESAPSIDDPREVEARTRHNLEMRSRGYRKATHVLGGVQ